MLTDSEVHSLKRGDIVCVNENRWNPEHNWPIEMLVRNKNGKIIGEVTIVVPNSIEIKLNRFKSKTNRTSIAGYIAVCCNSELFLYGDKDQVLFSGD